MSEQLNQQSVVSRSDNQVSADMQGEVALMSITNGKYYSLNETGARIWSLIEKPASISDVCKTIHEEFDVDQSTCQTAVLSVISSLADEGLVEVQNAVAA